jgi:hypothetical protein
MSFHAANPAGISHLSSCPVEPANKSLSTRNYGGELRPSCRGYAYLNRAAIAGNFRSQCADENFALAEELVAKRDKKKKANVKPKNRKTAT